MRIFCADLNAPAVQVTDPESGWAVETYTTEPGKADRLTGKLSVVDFESTLRKFLSRSRRSPSRSSMTMWLAPNK